MSWADFFSNEETVALLIPITGIVVGGIVAIVVIMLRHRERMALIEQGLHPDHPPEEADPEQDPAARPEAFEPTGSYGKRNVPARP